MRTPETEYALKVLYIRSLGKLEYYNLVRNLEHTKHIRVLLPQPRPLYGRGDAMPSTCTVDYITLTIEDVWEAMQI